MSRTSPEVREMVVIIGGLVSNICNITPATEFHKGICASSSSGILGLDLSINMCYKCIMRNAYTPYPDNRVSLAHNLRRVLLRSRRILSYMYSRSRSRRT